MRDGWIERDSDGRATKVYTVEDIGRPYTVEDRPLAWQLAGRQQTASGYGRKLTSTRVVRFEGDPRPRRVYVTIFSNAGTAWINYRGTQWVVRD